MSTVNNPILEVTGEGSRFIWRKKQKGPSTDPWIMILYKSSVCRSTLQYLLTGPCIGLKVNRVIPP